MSEDLKFCKDCKWVRYWLGATCVCPNVAEINLVTGEVVHPFAKNARSLFCGREGRFFEEK